MMSRFSSLALENRPGTASRGAPNLIPNWQMLFESSARIRIISFAPGCTRAILHSSSTLSKVILSTPHLAALRIKEVALQGLANMILDGSMPPMLRTWLISPAEAQSNPAPREASSRRMYGSGLHLMAENQSTYVNGP